MLELFRWQKEQGAHDESFLNSFQPTNLLFWQICMNFECNLTNACATACTTPCTCLPFNYLSFDSIVRTAIFGAYDQKTIRKTISFWNFGILLVTILEQKNWTWMPDGKIMSTSGNKAKVSWIRAKEIIGKIVCLQILNIPAQFSNQTKNLRINATHH